MYQALVGFFNTQLPAKPDPNDGFSSQAEYERAVHDWHVRQVERRRLYIAGRQYDELNAACLASAMEQARQAAAEAGVDGQPISEKDIARGALGTPPLPEHIRMHEYTSALRSSVEYLTGRLVSGFGLHVAAPEGVAEDANLQVHPEQSRAEQARQVVLAAFGASPLLTGAKVGDLNWTTITRDVLQVGDVPVLLRWSPNAGDDIDGTVWLEFWPSEGVDMRWRDVGTLDKVIIRQQQWRKKIGSDDEELVTVRREWEVLAAETTAVDKQPREECLERWWVEHDPRDEDHELILTIRWGVPFLPWWALRASTTSLDSVRGDSVITDLVMKTADRLNALEDVAWKIARYNSHATLGVVGDRALLASMTTGVIHRDVADIVPLPSGTQAIVLELPTDPQMIEHQRDVLVSQIHDEFGLTRTDQGQLENLGQITGYALEILNQRADGTFSMIQQRLGHDVLRVANLILDCTAYWRQTGPGEQTLDDGQPVANVEPTMVFPDREFEVTLGSGSVVDQVLLRDSVIAGLISRRSALRRMGWSAQDIERNERELAEQRQEDATAARTAVTGGGTESGTFRGTRSGAGRVASTASDRGEGR